MRDWTRVGRLGVVCLLGGCGSTVVTSGSGGSSTGSGMGGGVATSTSVSSSTGVPPTTKADKVDIVFLVDNSSSMADKQQILGSAVRDLLMRLINPDCVDANGGTSSVANPTDPCPAGSQRQFQPVADINLGIVDSSLGGMGSDACPENLAGFYNDDKGHLIARSTNNTPTYMNEGFLAWDAKNTRQGMTDPVAFVSAATSLVIGVGEKGCGYEQQLEALTRFLVVPRPYDNLQKGSGGIPPVFPMGEDMTLEQQRAAFLRPDSALLVVVLSDENDFSINWLGPQNYAPWNSAPFYRASSMCQTSPGDKCCYSCGLGPPSGCVSDPSCTINNGFYTAQEDGVNLKESQAKKKYGFNPNFPVARYVNAFSQLTIDTAKADLSVTDPAKAVPNPIFMNVMGSNAFPRDPGLVFFTAIVGVPYQAVARDPSDLSKGFKNYNELVAADFFTQYVGDPDKYQDPTNPIMQESTAKRGVTGAGAPNGGDRSLNTVSPNDIQYACIFPLPNPNSTGIDCLTADSPDNPLCSGASMNSASEPQLYAKAYPGLRELSVARGLAQQGIITSICPQNTNDPTKADFGYRPAMSAIVERMIPRLK